MHETIDIFINLIAKNSQRILTDYQTLLTDGKRSFTININLFNFSESLNRSKSYVNHTITGT